jgi:uncharacterized protein YjiS (DUF1127 family)
MTHASTDFATASAASAIAVGGKVLQLVSSAFGWVAEQRRVSRTIATLSSLSDATLRDIGIERGDIEQVARYGRTAFRGRA